MLRDRDDAPADLAVLEGRSPRDLSSDALREFRLLMAMRQPEHAWNFLPDDQFLPAAGILGRGSDGISLHPTLAGLLLLGHRGPLREVFPNLRLVYEEADTGFTLTTHQSGQPENLFEFYRLVSRRLTAVSSLLTKDHPEDLAAALREAVLNAILHADYFSRGGLTIRRTHDRLQVENAGLLRVSPEEARQGGAADPRNLVLTRLFALVKLGTGNGKGLRGIYSLWAQQGWSAPVLSEAFKAGVTSLSLSLPRRTFAPQELTRQQIAEYLTDHITATLSQLNTALGLPLEELRATLEEMTKEALVVQEEEGYRLRA
jgi:predicted HTH transcriptional regulator